MVLRIFPSKPPSPSHPQPHVIIVLSTANDLVSASGYVVGTILCGYAAWIVLLHWPQSHAAFDCTPLLNGNMTSFDKLADMQGPSDCYYLD